MIQEIALQVRLLRNISVSSFKFARVNHIAMLWCCDHIFFPARNRRLLNIRINLSSYLQTCVLSPASQSHSSCSDGTVMGNPVGLAWRSQTVFILTTIDIVLFGDIFLFAVIVPIVPFMLEELANVSPTHVLAYVSLILTPFY